MKLYEINSELQHIINEVYQYAEEHDGEIPADLAEKLNLIQQEKEIKVLSIGRWYKNLNAEEEAIQSEIEKLTSRRMSVVKKLTTIENFLETFLSGQEKYSDGAVKISFRRSERLAMTTEDIQFIPEKFLRPQPPKIDRAGIKEAIKSGEKIDFAKIEIHNNIQIK